MQPEQLEQNLKQGILNSLYLLYGEEEFLLNTCVKRIKKLFGEKIIGINYIQIDEQNIESLIQELQTPAFGYPKKLIVIKNSGLFKKAKAGTKKKESNKDLNLETNIANYIEQNLKTINESAILVFIENEVDKNNLVKTIEQYGITCNFQKLNPSQIASRLKAICNAYRVNIDNNTMQLFIETCGLNMQVLINEIRKLIEYSGENGTITKEAINLLSTKEIEAVIFDLTDNLGKKNIKKALEILHQLLYNKEPIQKILVTLYNHFKKLYITSLAIENNNNISESLCLKPNQVFLVNKYKIQVKYFSINSLKKIIEELINLDYNNKIGNIDLKLGLEAIICTYCD